jgi:hypothetical protein
MGWELRYASAIRKTVGAVEMRSPFRYAKLCVGAYFHSVRAAPTPQFAVITKEDNAATNDVVSLESSV